MLQNTPQVVKNLIILNVLVYFGSGLLGDAAVPFLAGTYPGSPFFQPWQLVTHMFMHGDLGHIFFNMFALYMFGSQLERVWGPQRFLTYYMACGLGAFVLHELVIGLQFYAEFGTFFPADMIIIAGLVGPDANALELLALDLARLLQQRSPLAALGFLDALFLARCASRGDFRSQFRALLGHHGFHFGKGQAAITHRVRIGFHFCDLLSG